MVTVSSFGWLKIISKSIKVYMVQYHRCHLVCIKGKLISMSCLLFEIVNEARLMYRDIFPHYAYLFTEMHL